MYEQYVLISWVSIYNVLVSSSDIKAAILYHLPVNCIIPNMVCIHTYVHNTFFDMNYLYYFEQIQFFDSHYY